MKNNEPSTQNESQEKVEQFFREAFGAIHVPPQLKEKTLHKMLEKQAELQEQQEYQSEDAEGGKVISLFKQPARIYRLSALAAVFVLLIIGTVFFSGPRATVSPIRADGLITDYSTMFRAAGDVRVEEMASTALPDGFPNTLYGFRLTDTHSYVVSDANDNLLDEILLLAYTKGEMTFSVVCSSKQLLAPASLYTTQPQTIAGIPVYIGKDPASKTIYAAWSANELLVASRMDHCSKQTALKLLEALLNVS